MKGGEKQKQGRKLTEVREKETETSEGERERERETREQAHRSEGERKRNKRGEKETDSNFPQKGVFSLFFFFNWTALII